MGATPAGGVTQASLTMKLKGSTWSTYALE